LQTVVYTLPLVYANLVAGAESCNDADGKHGSDSIPADLDFSVATPEVKSALREAITGSCARCCMCAPVSC
jgi:hypothetical protein